MDIPVNKATILANLLYELEINGTDAMYDSLVELITVLLEETKAASSTH